MPAFTTALSFFDGYRSEVVPANLLQAQRDYFGAHTFLVLPGKENERFVSGENIRAFSFHLSGQRDGDYRADCRSLSQQTSTGPGVVEMSRPGVTSRRAVLPWRTWRRVRLSGIGRSEDMQIVQKVKLKVDTLYRENLSGAER